MTRPDAPATLDPWWLEHLVCPVEKSPLRLEGRFLVSQGGRRYPVVDGAPVMLPPEATATIRALRASLELATAIAEAHASSEGPLYLTTLGVSKAEREVALQLYASGADYDPVVAVAVGATSGYAYRRLIGKVGADYPIPAFRFPTPAPGRLLDIGSNWGRWTLAAARAGHAAVGIDPQLAAVLAGARVARQLGLPARFLVGDARFLPFRADAFDYAWSYSVLQHFAPEDANAALREVGRVVRPGGLARVQMANRLGLRSLFHMARRRFRRPRDFEVRYWTPASLVAAFDQAIGPTRLDADCFLGLGLQWSDFGRMGGVGKAALLVSEAARRTSIVLPPLKLLADSLFCTARRGEGAAV
jgi:SAM-dependent methyltransferase/uncharacterized protein YbaR (Trm112 family)